MTTKNESAQKNVTIEDIKNIVAEMKSYYEAHPDKRNYIFHDYLSFENYARELALLSLNSYYELMSDDERAHVDAVVEAVTEYANSWRCPNAYYTYVTTYTHDWDQNPDSDLTELEDRLWDAVHAYFTQNNLTDNWPEND